MHWKSAYGIGPTRSTSGAELAERRARPRRPRRRRPRSSTAIPTHGLALQVRGHELLGRAGEEHEAACRARRARRREVAVARGATSARRVAGPQHETGGARSGRRGAAGTRTTSRRRSCRRHRAAPRTDPGCSSSLAVTSRPSAVTRSTDDEVVAREPVLALEPARPAAEREPGDAGGRHAAAGGGEPVLLRGAVELAPRDAGADARRSAVGVDLDARHRPDVDDDAAVVDATSPPPSARRRAPPPRSSLSRAKLRAPRPTSAGGSRTAAITAGPLVDHRVEDRPRLVVAARRLA